MAGDEGIGSNRRYVAGGGGDRIAVGIGRGVFEQGIDAGEEFFGDDVFEFLGFGVDFGPIEADGFDEEEFDEAVAADDVEGELFASGGEAYATARLIGDEAGIGEGLDHGGGGAGHDVNEGGEASHEDGFFGRALLLL